MKKKLVFKKSTLRQLGVLSDAQLGRVAGGKKAAPGEEIEIGEGAGLQLDKKSAPFE